MKLSTVAVLAAAALVLSGCGSPPERAPRPLPVELAAASTATCAPGAPGKTGRAVRTLAKKFKAENHVRAAIVRVTRHGRNVATFALGSSMTRVPATVDMRFRAGAVAIADLATALLLTVEDGRASLDDPVRRWVPDARISKKVTLRMLANSTSGIPDYVPDTGFSAKQLARPFRTWSEAQLLDVTFSHASWYRPGTNWSYSHANFILLGKALTAITRMPLRKLLRTRVFQPAGRSATTTSSTAAIAGPVLHAYSSERGRYEDSTFWNPSWTLAHGAIETTDICDLATSARVVGRGDLLTKASHRKQLAPRLVGLGGPTPTCPDVCRKQTASGYYGLGVVVLGGWVLQNPSFAGYGATQAYLPSKDLAIAVSATKKNKADLDANLGFGLFQQIATMLAPGSPPRR
jgi:CubicO group peptidase (beta-lactamase class C family)